MVRINNIQIPLNSDVSVEKELDRLFREEIKRTGRKKKDIGLEAFMFYFQHRGKIEQLEQNACNNDETNKKLDELIHIVKNIGTVTVKNTEHTDDNVASRTEIESGIDFDITADDLEGIA